MPYKFKTTVLFFRFKKGCILKKMKIMIIILMAKFDNWYGKPLGFVSSFHQNPEDTNKSKLNGQIFVILEYISGFKIKNCNNLLPINMQ